MSESPRWLESLLERQLLIISGKGGVGKTTVACLLALLAARRGKRVLVAEVDGAGQAARLLGVSQPSPFGVSTWSDHGPAVMSVEGVAALEEYLGILLPMPALLRTVFQSRLYQYFVAAAPGLKELMTIGKIWFEVDRSSPNGTDRVWDLVILDAPATGHGLQYLRMPKAAEEVFRGGLVGRESDRLWAALSDPRRTAVNLVATAEETPVNETIEMYRHLREDLALPMGVLVVNRRRRSPLIPSMLGRLERKVASFPVGRDRPLALEILRRCREESGWDAIHAAQERRLQQEVDLPTIELPFLFSESFGFPEIERLALDAVSTGAMGPE